MKLIEKILPTQGQVYKPSQPFCATLIENQRITPPESVDDIRHLVFDLTGSGIEYLEGQSMGVVPPGETVEGKRHKVRLYSISSARCGDDGKCATVSLTVKRILYLDDQGQEKQGLSSNYLTSLPIGAKVMLTGPVGRKFLLPQEDSVNLIMVAVGTGIAPFRSFIEHIYREKGGWKGCIRLFYGAKTGLESLYMNQEKTISANTLPKKPSKPLRLYQEKPRGKKNMCKIKSSRRNKPSGPF